MKDAYLAGELNAQTSIDLIEQMISSPDRRLTSLREARTAWNVERLIGMYGAVKLSKWIGARVWTHGNTWKKGARLSPRAAAWLDTFVHAYKSTIDRAIKRERPRAKILRAHP